MMATLSDERDLRAQVEQPESTQQVDFSLLGKVVIVTEGLPDDSLGIPRRMAAAGATLAITATDPEKLAETISLLTDEGYTARAYRLDFRDLDSIPRAVDAVVSDFARVDVLINNVGYNLPSLGVDVAAGDWYDVFQMNATGPFFAAQAAGRHMIAARTGSIINVGTHSAVKCEQHLTTYGAARAAMAQFTRNLALEWAEFDVRVNSVAPLFIKAYNLATYPEMYESQRLRNPMRRFATENEVAAAIQFLACDASAYITGHTLMIDGGSVL